ncbi:DUF2461 domain-containing protein [Trujillonella humicola]|uniref:DUF2461 domain-containing protein n=1 Tax=Trujillonella humicola TaxID=3383699 RepID=UPI0039065372
MTFEGFPDEGLVFYEGLEADNSKTYWTGHRPQYESCVRAPLQALVDELAGEFGPAKLFRPYRDVRFSNDKTPYKTHQGAVVEPPGRGAGAWYVQISADGLRVAGGCWRLESDQVTRYRRAVEDDVQGRRLADEVARLATRGWEVGGDRLTRQARGFDVPDDDRANLLRHRSLHVWQQFEPAPWLHQREALDRVRETWRDVEALNAWLADNVGATAKEPRRR